MTPGFADHFSGVASHYSRFRPRYPGALFDWIESVSAPGASVWDCAAGSGQASVSLAERFPSVIATDASAAQVDAATPHPRISWRVARAEDSGIDAHSIHLITIGQALHWFDLPAFWQEVRRVAAPGAVVAAWTYGDPSLDTPELNTILHDLMHGTLDAFWPPERAHIDARYKTIDFPFTALPAPDFTMTESWSAAEFIGYQRSWSATARYLAEHGDGPLRLLALRLEAAWGEARRPVRWPVTVLAGTV